MNGDPPDWPAFCKKAILKPSNSYDDSLFDAPGFYISSVKQIATCCLAILKSAFASSFKKSKFSPVNLSTKPSEGIENSSEELLTEELLSELSFSFGLEGLEMEGNLREPFNGS